jgi:hypothetical protein
MPIDTRPVSTTGTGTGTGTGESCPYCRGTDGVQPITGTSPVVQAWSCTACRTNWAITTVNPQPYLDRLGATVEQLGATRSVLRQLIMLSGEAPGLTDEQPAEQAGDAGRQGKAGAAYKDLDHRARR